MYTISSRFSREDVAESIPKTQSFGGSSIHFSPSGKIVLIDDDTPEAASSDGHKLILGTLRDGPIVKINALTIVKINAVNNGVQKSLLILGVGLL